MNRNPVIPYVWIMVLGIGLMIGLGFKGLGDAEQLAKELEGGEEAEKTEEVADAGPEDIYSAKCLSCHGDQKQGGVGPALTNISLSEEEVADVLTNGRGTMPGGLVPPEQVDAMAKWLLGQE
ncbi:cytochrome c [Bacillus aquiflavi]|uniref:Cytochrome c n=1 Tax=Bacillus aquiflavi TaxID=2672567 RepID=A0A6B3VPJ4_9BACI|nr:cytochrome c [Bacillus aquiflavi]MBA4535855.1 cytochrome c [Bacillus aquiflavi]NEY80230.1 cytochrome c [Bacillus aquiflavi]UAC47280.1 cytochrome c [Bacillus aquiflavi]